MNQNLKQRGINAKNWRKAKNFGRPRKQKPPKTIPRNRN